MPTRTNVDDQQPTEPEVRYTRSPDGTSIAYSTWGSGAPLVQMPSFPVSNLEIEWKSRRYRSYWQELAQDRMLVRYDCRGSGLSARDVKDYSLEALVSDMEAVVDRLALTRFALVGFGHSGPAAITYAARHSERVSHLILWYTYARASDYSRAPRVEAGRSLIEQDWELYTELEGHRSTIGIGTALAAQRYTTFLRESVSSAGLLAAFSAIREVDVTGLLPGITVPTLVMHRRGSRILDVAVAQELASTIPDARLRLLDGSSLAPFVGDVEATIREVRAFLAEPFGGALPDGLSPREGEVLGLIARGRSNREIAALLTISERTVARHITNLYQKIGAHNKSEATAYALRHKMQ